MNDDALAAVVAAATMLLKRRTAVVPLAAGARWRLAARLRIVDATDARRVAGTGSRWSHQGRP